MRTISEAISARIPNSLKLTAYHLSSRPTKSNAIWFPPPGRKPTPTSSEPHFIVVSHDGILIFAIEILIYFCPTSNRITIFISKADSSGYLPSSAACFTTREPSAGISSLMRVLAETCIQFILDGVYESEPLAHIMLSLFARSQSQYLFPNSGANQDKHILNDQALIKWWSKVCTPLISERASNSNIKAHLLVPGCDQYQVKKMFPDGAVGKLWIHGHPFELSPSEDITVREVIPYFPDDPKARFLDELNGEDGGMKSTKRGPKWAGVRTVDEFWELMSHRQECSLGRCVGFIWITIKPLDDVALKSHKSALSTAAKEMVPQLPAESPSDDHRTPKKRPLSGEVSLQKEKRVRPDGAPPSWRPIVSPTTVLDDKRYRRAIDSLLHHGDFGNKELAKTSTHKWVKGVSAMLTSSHRSSALDGNQDWGEHLEGQLDAMMLPPMSSKDSKVSTTVKLENKINVLNSNFIRKKR